MSHLKYGANEPIYKTEMDSQTWRADLWLPKGEGRGGGMDWECKVSRCEQLYLGWINKKVLLKSTGNYIQYPRINHNGQEYKKKCIYVYNSHFAV